MSIAKNQPSKSKYGLKGISPKQREGAKISSTLHNKSSIVGDPVISRKPSSLDLNGTIGKKYLDNKPK